MLPMLMTRPPGFISLGGLWVRQASLVDLVN
jgi:hypothetical protein